MKQKKHLLNWKVLLMSLGVNMIAITITVIILPGMTIAPERWLINIALLAIGLGLLNTFIKPILQ